MGVIHATNPRYQKIPPGLYTTDRCPLCARTVARTRVTVVHDGILHERPVHGLPGKWAPGNYVEQIDDRNRILINSTRDSVRTW